MRRSFSSRRFKRPTLYIGIIFFILIGGITLFIGGDETTSMRSSTALADIDPTAGDDDQGDKISFTYHLSSGIDTESKARPAIVPTEQNQKKRPKLTDSDDPIGKYLDRETVELRPGTGLMDLLTERSVARGDAHSAIQAMRDVFSPRRLKAGQDFTLLFEEIEGERRFSGFSFAPTPLYDVAVIRGKLGGFAAERHDKEIKIKPDFANGVIDQSLFVNAAEAGVPTSAIVSLIHIYSWDVDFQRDIRKGDRFEIFYDQKLDEDGNLIDTGDIKYAKLTLSGREIPIYRFTMADGRTDYFKEDGKSIRRALLKTPIDGARLTSGYGMRHHPILGYSKMHKGVDFAAPVGTPIYAAGDGVIERRGRWGGYGNYIRIRHNNGLKTAYAHLKGFKSGQGVGTRVKQGEVIGYLGNTGRSTGPHLHYEIMENGRQVNPNSLDLPEGITLAASDRQAFFDHVGAIKRDIARINNRPDQDDGEDQRLVDRR